MGDVTELYPTGQGDQAQPPSTVGALQDLVDEMILAVREAKGVPLSANVLVDREEFLTMLERLRGELPEELRAARWMVREREAFIARTNEKARDIVEKARARAAEMVSESRIMAEAVEEANALVRRAEGESRRIRLEAEDRIERQYEQLESLFGNLLADIRASRAELHQAREPEPPPPG